MVVKGFCFSASDSFFWWGQSESLKHKLKVSGIVMLVQSGGEGVKVMPTEPTLALLRHLWATSRILWTLSTNQRDKSFSQVAFWLWCWVFLSNSSLETWALWIWSLVRLPGLANVFDYTLFQHSFLWQLGSPSVCLHWSQEEGTEGEKRCLCHLLRFWIFWEKGSGERDQLTCSYSAEW